MVAEATLEEALAAVYAHTGTCNGVTYEPLAFEKGEELRAAFYNGRCDAIAGFGPFLSATLMWRQASKSAKGVEAAEIAERLIVAHARDAENDPAIGDLLRIVEQMRACAYCT